MSKWNIFSKNKKDEKTEEIKEETQESYEENSEEKPLATYKKTLYSEESRPKNQGSIETDVSDQHIWRDVDSIEKNVDNLHIKKGGEPSSEVDKKVDEIIKKTKSTARKPSNVIYVVSSPQPGQVKGDWAVKGHKKVYSHHRKKESAIKKARKVAKKRDATVMVQNTDGTFSDGFKPRSKK